MDRLRCVSGAIKHNYCMQPSISWAKLPLPYNYPHRYTVKIIFRRRYRRMRDIYTGKMLFRVRDLVVIRASILI